MVGQRASQNSARSAGSMATAGGSTLVARIIAQGAQLALFLVAARVLAPAEFGVFSIAVAVYTFFFVIGAAGWNEFVLGWRGDERATTQAIAYAAMGGYLLSAIGVIIAAVTLLVFQAPAFSILILIFSGTLLLGPLTYALGGVLVRKGAVLHLSMVIIVAELLGLAAGIAGLMAGWSIIALGVAKIVMQVIHFVGVVIVAKQPIRLVLNGGYAAEIFEVSRSILSNRIISFISGNSSTFLIGAFLGMASVGYYRAAERVVSAVSEMLFEPMRLIAWMVFRQAADDAATPGEGRELLAQESRFFFPLLILCAAPVFVGLAIVSDDLVHVFLGEKWAPAASVVMVLAVAGLFYTPTIANEPLLTIAGKTKVLAPVALFNAASTATIFLVFTQFGLMAAAYARLGASAIVLITSLWIQGKHAGAAWWGAAKAAAPVYAGVIGLIIAVVFANLWLATQDIGVISRLGLEVFVGAVAYFFMILLVRPSFLRNTLSLA